MYITICDHLVAYEGNNDDKGLHVFLFSIQRNTDCLTFSVIFSYPVLKFFIKHTEIFNAIPLSDALRKKKLRSYQTQLIIC